MSPALAQALRDFTPELPVAVAYSGGADSTALLLACAEQWPGQVSAIHVHHGLQAAADDFERHCRAFCAQLGVPLHVVRVDARHASGQSPEDAARRARYQVFDELARSQPDAVGSIALAQQADDQVETLLLALSRGAGLPGLSAMPAQWQRHGVRFYRPLLAVPGAELRHWLDQRGVDYVTDPSNSDERFTRNRIRARLLPALQAVFPQFRDTFARSAAHAAQAQTLLDEVAVQDLLRIGVPPVIAQLQALSQARQANVLRHWLRGSFDTVPSAAQMQELLHQIAACTTRGHRLHLKVGTGFVRREGPVLSWYNPTA
jgi:tRNA(Ile)-lysidine synthase